MSRALKTSKVTLVHCLAIIAAFGLASCSEDVHQEVLTTDDRTQVKSDVVNSTELSDDAKNSFQRELDRDGYQPYGKTVRTILSDAKRDEAKDQAEAAAAAEQTRALNKDLTIYPASISVTRGGSDFGSIHVDNLLDDKDTFAFLIQNNGSKTIASFSADATLTNQGDEVLYDGTLNDATAIAPGSEEKLVITTTPMDFAAVPHQELVRHANISSVVVHYTVQKIQYSNGTSISRNP
jgi:hypothetical protein